MESRKPDPAEHWAAMADVPARLQSIMLDYLKRQQGQDGFQIPDPQVVGEAFLDFTTRLMLDPAKLVAAQIDLWRQYADLWQTAAKRFAGEDAEPVAAPAKEDRRFADPAWNDEAVFDVLKQSYLVTARWMQSQVKSIDGMDDQTRRKVEFYTRQYVDAMSPSNFLMTNPTVLKKTVETGGENLVKGLDQLLTDLERGHGRLSISMTDYDAFHLGENVATTPGKVVYQNDLMQLVQYAPTTETVLKRPLLIVPPWINKFYVLDLRPKNSFIKWAVDQGHTVFVISWVNPDVDLSHKGFSDYLAEGPLAALDVIGEISGQPDINIIGYCIGGTLTACALSYLADKGDDRIKSATFFTAMTDFREPGELRVFIDEQQLDLLDKHMAGKGYLEGRHMAQVFNLMRDNDLIWSFVVNNYLLGREPFPFDLLYWNSDSTRMPAMMHSFYLRKMYQENRLIEPDGITLLDTPIDLRRVKVPVYMLSTKEDHIAPWKSTYAATQIYQGKVKFVLSASGHIAGVVNPPAAEKYCYWTNAKLPADPDAWLEGAKQNTGSWWPDWHKWVSGHGGGQVPARQPGSTAHPPIEDAPGSYVKVRLPD